MAIVKHAVHVHTSACVYTQEYLLKLRRWNYVSPKHYLDFINMYLKLLDEKNIYIKDQVMEEGPQLTKPHLQLHHYKCHLQYTRANRKIKFKTQGQSQSHITTDTQSASPSWCQAPIWDTQPIFLSP
jgi:hypothetical protein